MSCSKEVMSRRTLNAIVAELCRSTGGKSVMQGSARCFGIAALAVAAVLLPNAVAVAARPADAPPIGVTGHWSDQRFIFDVLAINTGSGVQGRFTIKKVSTGTVFGGPITQIVLPSGTQDFFCVSGPFTIGPGTPGQGEAIYLKPGGNGPGAVSQWSADAGGGTGGGLSCATNPAPPGEFQTLTPPDFIRAIPAAG